MLGELPLGPYGGSYFLGNHILYFAGRYRIAGLLLEDFPAEKIRVKQAYAAGLKVGVYFYSQAVTETEAIEEAKICLEAIKDTGCKIEYPVIMDVEGDNTRLGKISKAQRTANIKAFCETIIDGGYYPMVYANQVWMDEKIDMSQIDYDIWMACYKDPKCVKTVFGIDIPFTMWQYGGRNVPGIRTGAVDVNISLVNYPDFLKKHGWNNL